MSWNLALRSFLSRIQEGSCHVEAMKLWKGHWPRQIQTKLQGINSRSITHQHSSEEVTKLSRIQIVFHLETCKVPLHFISQALQIWEVFLGFSLSFIDPIFMALSVLHNALFASMSMLENRKGHEGTML